MNAPKNNPLSETWAACLQENGYRLTAPRRAIVEIMADSWRPLSALELYDLGRHRYPRLGLVTVYRTLEKLEQLGLIQRLHHPAGCHTFLPVQEGHTHLLICTACGRTVPFSGDDLSGLITETARRSGYLIQDHWLQFFGLCAECQDIPR
jgi:Fe2+ or Zn2+ uptake regulation protein